MRKALSPDAEETVKPTRGEVDFYQDENGWWHTVRPVWWQRNLEDSVRRLGGQKMPRSAYLYKEGKKRLISILTRLNLGDGFLCEFCGERIPFHRNANARFCGPQCYQEATKRRRSPNKKR
ncbi:hypothetical protein [Ruegeria arenilitoris]|uniref:hypothetical protein n=1 Tax=Ruegeria arenilitoris TaxID=1173585 RepID=UPI00148041C7|nr:hypothetical protein [Ruegeria arenilitoris]